MLLRVLNQRLLFLLMEIFLHNVNFSSFNSVFKEFKISHNLESFIYLVKNPSHNLGGDFDLKKMVCLNKIESLYLFWYWNLQKKIFLNLMIKKKNLGIY